MLDSLLAELGALCRSHDEHDLANWIDQATARDAEGLPQRVPEIFTHAMGGPMDRPLYSDGQFDSRATERRDALADEVYEQARARLQ